MNSLTVFEFDKIVETTEPGAQHAVPAAVFQWLEAQSLGDDGAAPPWLRPSRHRGQRAVQVTSWVGVIRTPCGFQIEVLPKIGRATSANRARARLLSMLQCLPGFRYIRTANAELEVRRMPLLEVFIQQFLDAVGTVIKRGLRSDYVSRRDNLTALRGRLLVARHVARNSARRDRFFTEHDEFSPNRAENRLLRSALRLVLTLCQSQHNQRAAREFSFVFADVPLSADVDRDIQRIRIDRGMDYYQHAIDWATLILRNLSPLSGKGRQSAPSLLFPMEAVFEAYVEKHLPRQLCGGYALKAQASSRYLVEHNEQRWFRMKPDLLIKQRQAVQLVLDTKWKLLDANHNDTRRKYRLSQTDFYQLYAYAQHYLDGDGDVVLIYPKTDAFDAPLPVFTFPRSPGVRLWVLPFCLDDACLIVPNDQHGPRNAVFERMNTDGAQTLTMRAITQ